MRIFAPLMALMTAVVLLLPQGAKAQPPVGSRYRPGSYGQTGGYSPRPDQSRGFITGTVVLAPEEKDGEDTPGVGVTVLIRTIPSDPKIKADTLYSTVGEEGKFFFRNIPVGKAYVSFSMMGYEEQANTMTVNSGMNKVIATLKPEKFAIKAAVLKETVPPITIEADTIVFNAAAVRTLKGERALDVLEQMPGVEVSESSVTVLNETVENVYVDGALLFGSAPMRALNNLPAEEVVTIRSYQEYANKDPRHKISKNESRQRVLDIQTKTRPKLVVNGDFIAGGGFDTDSTYHKFRYTTGGTVMANSEKFSVIASVNLNNINDASNRQRGSSFRQTRSGGSPDLRAASVSLDISRRWMSPTTRNFILGSVGFNYGYDNKYNVTESITERIYFPTEKYTNRRYESSSFGSTTNKVHDFSMIANKSIPDGHIRAKASYSITDKSTVNRSHSYNYQDDKPRQGTASSKATDTDGRSYDISLSANKGFFDKLRLSASADISRNSNDGLTTKIDTTTSTITRTVLDITSGTASRSMSVNPTIRYEVSDRSSLSAGYTYSKTYSQSDQFAYDVTDPSAQTLDVVNTHKRTNDNNTHSAHVTFRSAFGKKNTILDARLAYKSVGINRSELFPVEDPVYSRRFNSLRPNISIGPETMLGRWSFNYSSSTNNPSVEELRPRINNTNLYNVSVGNPDLKQSTSHTFRFSYSTVLGKESRQAVRDMESGSVSAGRPERYGNFSTISFDATFGLQSDEIVNRRTYFETATYLPEYDYTMPAQSNFITYENASGGRSASANVRYSVPVKFIGCTVNSGIHFNWDKSPAYVNDVLTMTENYRPSVRLGLRSDFSRTFRFNIGGSAAYVHSFNSERDIKNYFTEEVNAGFEVNNILQHGYLGGNYTKTFNQGLGFVGINDNVLDLQGGFKFGPRNNVDISMSIHDLFNKTRGFSTAMKTDYVQNSWNHNFGRYVMFRLAYHFSNFGRHSGGDSRGSHGPGGFGGPGGYGGYGGPGGFGGPGGYSGMRGRF